MYIQEKNRFKDPTDPPFNETIKTPGYGTSRTCSLKLSQVIGIGEGDAERVASSEHNGKVERAVTELEISDNWAGDRSGSEFVNEVGRITVHARPAGCCKGPPPSQKGPTGCWTETGHGASKACHSSGGARPSKGCPSLRSGRAPQMRPLI